MTVFAGDRIEQFMNKNKPDYGMLGTNLASYGSAERVADTELAAKIEAAQMTADAQVKAAKLTGQAASAQAGASVFGSAMGALGKIGGAGIGAIPTNIGSMDVTTPVWQDATKDANSWFSANI